MMTKTYRFKSEIDKKFELLLIETCKFFEVPIDELITRVKFAEIKHRDVAGTYVHIASKYSYYFADNQRLSTILNLSTSAVIRLREMSFDIDQKAKIKELIQHLKSEGWTFGSRPAR